MQAIGDQGAAGMGITQRAGASGAKGNCHREMELCSFLKHLFCTDTLSAATCSCRPGHLGHDFLGHLIRVIWHARDRRP